MTAELAEAERYQEAYTNLVEEVDALIQRNALAEDEAQRVSKFNAEILGHTNPAQKIMYVDRIRKELFETKKVTKIEFHPVRPKQRLTIVSPTETSDHEPGTRCH